VVRSTAQCGGAQHSSVWWCAAQLSMQDALMH
jgi:hypothetical protein